MPPVKNVGKPCAGEPHARFDGRGLETEPLPAETAPVPDPPTSFGGRDLSALLPLGYEQSDVRLAGLWRASVSR